jgi:hypothetical protein
VICFAIAYRFLDGEPRYDDIAVGLLFVALGSTCVSIAMYDLIAELKLA